MSQNVSVPLFKVCEKKFKGSVIVLPAEESAFFGEIPLMMIKNESKYSYLAI